MNNLIFTTDNDKYFDYTLHPYTPLSATKNKLKSINLLINSFEYMRCKNSLFGLVTDIQKKIGFDKTIFGIKKMNDEIFWEFYFYNYNKIDPLVTMSNIKKILHPYFIINSCPAEDINYFMFSIDIKKGVVDSGKAGNFHVYLSDYEKRAAGVCYLLKNNKLKLENYYMFYNPKLEKEEILKNIKSLLSINFNRVNLNKILKPEFLSCKKICIAKKKFCNGIYFSGLNIKQFLVFLKLFKYPESMVNFVEKNKSKLNHLMYDIGFDFLVRNQKVFIKKSSYYGIF